MSKNIKDLTWLWLNALHEFDDFEGRGKLSELVDDNGKKIKVISFQSPDDLSVFLMHRLMHHPDKGLDGYGLIVDDRMVAFKNIQLYQKLTDQNHLRTVKSAFVNGSGLFFLEEFVLKYWRNPPPTIIISLLATNDHYHNIEKRLEVAKKDWSRKYLSSPESAKIAWITTQKVTDQDVLSVIENWSK